MCSRISSSGVATLRARLATIGLWLVVGGCGDPNVEPADADRTSIENAPESSPDTPPADRAGDEPATRAAASPVAGAAPRGGRRAGEFGRLPPPATEQFPGLKPLSPEYDVWIDAAQKRVVLRGGVCLREGPLELFACIHQWVDDEFAEGGKVRRGTKEYESVVTVNTTAALVHTALLAVGAEPGSPARFSPDYEPARGAPIDVLLFWDDDEGTRQEARAQDWVRNVQTGEAMDHSWVFAGSGFRANESTGEKRYLGEEGNLICVSNFPDAVLDIPVESSSANAALLFEAYTDRIPPVGTSVTIVLVPARAE